MPAPTVSVVTPVYNTGRFLSECIESVLNQTYEDFEYVILDNDSSDDSLSIAKSYASKDSRIRVIAAKDHVGQVDNYNRSLREISKSSRFCKMVQADDFLMGECIEAMVGLAECDERIGLVSSYQLAGDHIKGAGLPCESIADVRCVMDGDDVCRRYLLDGTYVFGTPTSVLFRSDDVRSRSEFFAKSSYHEDSEACFELLKTSKFGFLHRILTYTRTDNDSLSVNVQSLQPDQLHRHIMLRKFGRYFLKEPELAEAEAESLRTVKRILVMSYGKPHGSARRAYYFKGLDEAGVQVRGRTIAIGLLLRGLRILGNPLRTFESVLERVGLIRGGNK